VRFGDAADNAVGWQLPKRRILRRSRINPPLRQKRRSND
jgi:hypothetical protein